MRGSRRFRLPAAIACAVGLAGLQPQAQEPEGPKNLQFFPMDIPRQELIQRMREFSFALGVRCQYCHAGGDGISFEGVEFDSDVKLAKRRARYMLEMVRTINTSLLSGVPERGDSGTSVDCATCHRGSAVPKLLATELTEVIEADGVDAAVARYRELRRDAVLGKYSFSEWTINELARELEEAGNEEAAIAMLEMNAEYHPESVAIDMTLGGLYLSSGDPDRAIAHYRRALAKQPDNEQARRRLQELEREPD
jgi:hypothetical protein